jgi:catalase
MEGFGVHTFRLVNADGDPSLVKFHWKPVAGVHSLVWEEAQLAAGADPDFHRRDMADGIESGAFLEYELGIQVFPDTDDETFEGIDLLDPTKIVPEELAEVQLIGKLTLNRNPTNYFAETEQVAFHTGNLVPGVEVTNDPLMQARLFSYLDTQLTRLGGPNFTQLPINCPHAAVNDNLRDGMHQTAIHTGLAPYLPNSVDRGAPKPAPESVGGYVQTPRMISGPAVRENPISFGDHFTQARMFWLSMTDVERVHIVEAYTFELGKVFEKAIKERTLGVLAQIDTEMCELVAAGLGLPAPTGHPAADVTPSPALSQIPTEPGPIAGRVVGVLAAPGADLPGIRKLAKTLLANGAVVRVISTAGGELGKGRSPLMVDRTLLTTRSIEYDAVVIADGVAGLRDIKLAVLLQEAFRHCKPLGGWGDAAQVLRDAGIDVTAPGILLTDQADKDMTTALITALGLHRVWDRAIQVMTDPGPGS